MSKIFQLIFITFLVASLTGFAQDEAREIETNLEGNFTYQINPFNQGDTPAAMLYDNGPAFNVAGGGPVAGSDLSLLENTTLGMNTLGFGHALSSGFRVADQFEVPATDTWTIDSIWFYAYQTNGGIPSTINFVSLAVWDGSPDLGTSSIVWGDQVTNYMTYTDFSNIYRHSETAPGTSRAMMVNTVTVGASFGEGTYWLDWQSGGTAASGPWAPPIAILGQAVTGDALQYNPTTLTWGPALDSGTGTPAQGFPFVIFGTSAIVPVELTSFAAVVNENDVVLNWSTATETNNQGFEVQRSQNGEFITITFVEGSGTTTEIQNYSYTDKNLNVGSYSYRLKQVDIDGTSELSNVVTVEVVTPDAFALEQNYPNPFNPSTMIQFSLAVDSRVTLTVYDLLGQEVTNLINGNLTAGQHEFDFNASNINSGVYFYKINATGIDGTNFTSIKKMILTK